MSASQGIKMVDKLGHRVIKDGIKQTSKAVVPMQRKPKHMRITLPTSGRDRLQSIKQQTRTLGLHTVCQEAKCPNLAECWSRGTATFMMLGKTCTRACKFCSVDTGNPQGYIDHQEPEKIANSLAQMPIDYAVITCVDRDDLADHGANILAQGVRAIKALPKKVSVEMLSGDFAGNTQALEVLLDAKPDVFAHNIETVRRMTPTVRDVRSTYDGSLNILGHAKQYQPKILVKSSLMLGIGERPEEVKQALVDLRDKGVDIVTLGQYLRPTLNHLPIDRWVSEEEFAQHQKQAELLGFAFAVAGPLVRSSYYAEKAAGLIDS